MNFFSNLDRLSEHDHFDNQKSALVIGAGSGGDILTSLLVVGRLKANNIKVDLTGFLTPWSLHSFNDKLEQPINRLNGQKTKKFIPTKELEGLPFFEPCLFELNKNQNLGINEIYLFSIQYGTQKLKESLQKLVSSKKYDLIIVVDVGGDSLARKKDFRMVYTPIVDFSCLKILNDIKTTAKKYMAVISPGVDGELNKTSLKEIITGYDNQGLICGMEMLKKRDKNNRLFLNALREINKHLLFTPHTTEIIRKIIECQTIRKKKHYIKLLKVNNKKWSIKYLVSLDPYLANKIFYFELEKICDNMPIKVDYETVAQAFKLFKKSGVGGTEVDLTYLPEKIQNGTYTKCIFVLNIFYRASSSQKKDITQYVMKLFSETSTSHFSLPKSSPTPALPH